LEDIFKCKPAIIRAFNASKGAAKIKNNKNADDYL